MRVKYEAFNSLNLPLLVQAPIRLITLGCSPTVTMI